MEGEEDEADTLPTLDYPGSGVNRSFVTSQATAGRREKSKYEDAERIKESAERQTKGVEPLREGVGRRSATLPPPSPPSLDYAAAKADEGDHKSDRQER